MRISLGEMRISLGEMRISLGEKDSNHDVPDDDVQNQATRNDPQSRIEPSSSY